MAIRGPQDLGGLPADAVRPDDEHEPTHWEKRVDAMMMLLFDNRRRLARVDESRRAQESIGVEAYRALSYYERWLTAIKWILLEKSVFSQEELDAKLAEVTARLAAERGALAEPDA